MKTNLSRLKVEQDSVTWMNYSQVRCVPNWGLLVMTSFSGQIEGEGRSDCAVEAWRE
jgi:hypothetical protein